MTKKRTDDGKVINMNDHFHSSTKTPFLSKKQNEKIIKEIHEKIVPPHMKTADPFAAIYAKTIDV